MKYIKTFEQYKADSVNESHDESLNEGVQFKDVQKIAREFLSATQSKFKVSDSQIHKSKKPVWKGMKKAKETNFTIKIVVPDKYAEKARDFAKDFKEEHKDEIGDMPIGFSVSTEIEGRKVLWPTNNKEFFDI